MGRAVLVVFCLLLLVAPARGAAFEIGVFDPEAGLPIGGLEPSTLQLARASGATRVRINVYWSRVATARPASPTDPGDPAYDWGSVDGAVAEARELGMNILLSYTRAPPWAEEPGRPSSAEPGAWKPQPADIAAFATALARRYPDVRSFQVWNEPNLSSHLAPQWDRRQDGDFTPFAAIRYREMLNAAYGAIKALDPANRLVTAGTAPYGDPIPGGNRTTPVRFWRQVMCLDSRLRRRACADPPHFDVLAHHPYGIAGPRQRALNPDDVTVADIGKLSRVLRAARKRQTALPLRGKPIWVTELSWDSSPPDPDGVPERLHAAWLLDALHYLWKQRVKTVLWFRVIDQAPIPSFPATNQSGLYLRDGSPKLAERAYAFPFACERIRAGRIRIWGIAPEPSSDVTVQQRSNGQWRSLPPVQAARDRVVSEVIAASSHRLRATTPTVVSLASSC